MSKHTLRATCRLTAFGETSCTIPYGDAPARAQALIAAWKERIPHRYRTYDTDSKAWRFWGGFEQLATALVAEFYPNAQIPHRARSHSTASFQPPGSDHFRVLHLRETAPVELIEASYRVLARLNHPDAGGSTEAMQAINGAYAALRERVSA